MCQYRVYNADLEQKYAIYGTPGVVSLPGFGMTLISALQDAPTPVQGSLKLEEEVVSTFFSAVAHTVTVIMFTSSWCLLFRQITASIFAHLYKYIMCPPEAVCLLSRPAIHYEALSVKYMLLTKQGCNCR